MAAKLTIHDIARLAGVSNATVSRVLNNKPDVNPETRERVLRIMEEQGFAPSIAAAGLAGRRSRLIGVLVPSLNWPFISEIVHGVAAVTDEDAYEIVLYTVPHEQDRRDVIDRILATKLTSGLLAIQVGQSAQYLSELYEQGFPVVMITDQMLQVDVACPLIDADHRAGAYEAVRHLIRLGHRRIAHIHGHADFRSSFERYEGYRDALLEAGIPPDPALVLHGDFKPPSGRECANQFFSMPQRPTAIFASNDEMAYGVLAAAEQHGLRIPRDVALVSFDDLPVSAHLYPPLTTVRQPFYEMGQQATTLLLSMIEGTGTKTEMKASRRPSHTTPSSSLSVAAQSDPTRVKIPTLLVVRESCGAPSNTDVPASSL